MFYIIFVAPVAAAATNNNCESPEQWQYQQALGWPICELCLSVWSWVCPKGAAKQMMRTSFANKMSDIWWYDMRDKMKQAYFKIMMCLVRNLPETKWQQQFIQASFLEMLLPNQSKKHVIATAIDTLPCSVLGLLVLNLFRFAGPGQVHKDVDDRNLLRTFWDVFFHSLILSSKLVSLHLDWLCRLPVDGKTLACDLCDPSTQLPHSRPKKSGKMNE